MKFIGIFFYFVSATASAADFCVTGVKGSLTSNFIFKVEKAGSNDRTLSILDNNRNPIFTSKAMNRFTRFNSTGYGVCSVVAEGVENNTGARYRAEIKVSPHYEKPCTQVTVPTNVEYVTLKITPKGTTLGDDLTAYALSIIRCP